MFNLIKITHSYSYDIYFLNIDPNLFCAESGLPISIQLNFISYLREFFFFSFFNSIL